MSGFSRVIFPSISRARDTSVASVTAVSTRGWQHKMCRPVYVGVAAVTGAVEPDRSARNSSTGSTVDLPVPVAACTTSTRSASAAPRRPSSGSRARIHASNSSIARPGRGASSLPNCNVPSASSVGSGIGALYMGAPRTGQLPRAQKMNIKLRRSISPYAVRRYIDIGNGFVGGFHIWR